MFMGMTLSLTPQFTQSQSSLNKPIHNQDPIPDEDASAHQPLKENL